MTESDDMFDNAMSLRYLDDAQRQPTPLGSPEDAKTYTDAELEEAGIVKTTAFVRTRRSKNALRVQKKKAKQAEEGIGQVNVEIPKDQAAALKDLARRAKAGEIDLGSLATPGGSTVEHPPAPNPSPRPQKETPVTVNPRVLELGHRAVAVEDRGGFRAFLLRRILG